MNKTVLGVVGILAIAGLTAFYIWSSHNRYSLTRGAEGVAYEVDRMTGESWAISGANKFAHKDARETQHKEQELAVEEARKISGNAALTGVGFYSGKLYNGSDWVVTRVVMQVSAIEEDGTTRWTRDLAASVMIEPLSTASFIVEVAGDNGIKNTHWGIKRVFGYKG